MNHEIQEKVKLGRPTDDTGMLLNLRKSFTFSSKTTEFGISGILNCKLLNVLSFGKNGRIGNLKSYKRRHEL